MRATNIRIAAPLTMVLALWFAGASYGQSLADLARQERARKEGQAKAAKEYTNDDIPAATLAAAAPTPAPEGKVPAAEQAVAAGETKPPVQAEKSPAEVEKEYRERAAKLKETQEFEERKLDVMQRELNLMQQQYYSDPNVALREQNTREEINKRTADIEAQGAAADKAKQAVADLEEELRRKGLPAGWAR